MEKLFLLHDNYKIPQWKMSLVFSLAVHLLVLSSIFFIPLNKKEPEAPFITRLITPEELKREFPSDTSASRPPIKEVKPGRRPIITKPVMKQAKRQAVTPYVPPSPPVQPKTNGSQKGAAIDNDTKSMMDKGPLEKGELTGAQTQKGSGIDNLQKSPGIIVPSPTMREKLFDREEIGKIAKREESKQDNGVTFDTKEFKYESYMLKLKDRIESIWRYPHEEAMRGIYGDLEISFTIKKNGMLGDVSLKRTSGHPNLDRAAMQALKDGQPFWPLPDEWGKDAITIDGHFVYSIYGTYIR